MITAKKISECRLCESKNLTSFFSTGNIYINDIDPWLEFGWINKKILINDCSFMVLKKIQRCSATNLRLNSDGFDINVPQKLREVYGHIDMGVYLKPLNDGTINIYDNIKLT